MRFFRFKVKLPNVGWVPASAFAKDYLTAEKEIESRFEGLEDIRFVVEQCIYQGVACEKAA